MFLLSRYLSFVTIAVSRGRDRKNNLTIRPALARAHRVVGLEFVQKPRPLPANGKKKKKTRKNHRRQCKQLFFRGNFRTRLLLRSISYAPRNACVSHENPVTYAADVGVLLLLLLFLNRYTKPTWILY